MHKLVLILFLFSSTIILGQKKDVLSKERYNFLVDSLTTHKNDLILKKKILKKQIDSLQNVIVHLESKVKSAHIKQLYKKYGKKIGGRLASGKVWKGMTERMLKDSWGEPDKKTGTKRKWGVFTQWYYGSITYYFKNGILTGWKEE